MADGFDGIYFRPKYLNILSQKVVSLTGSILSQKIICASLTHGPASPATSDRNRLIFWGAGNRRLRHDVDPNIWGALLGQGRAPGGSTRKPSLPPPRLWGRALREPGMPSSCAPVSILPASPPLSSCPPLVSKVPTSLPGHLLGFPKLQACARSAGWVAPGGGARLPVAQPRSQRGAAGTRCAAGEPPLTPGRRPSAPSPRRRRGQQAARRGVARVPEARCRRRPVPPAPLEQAG